MGKDTSMAKVEGWKKGEGVYSRDHVRLTTPKERSKVDHVPMDLLEENSGPSGKLPNTGYVKSGPSK
jgi:hypothetical protein